MKQELLNHCPIRRFAVALAIALTAILPAYAQPAKDPRGLNNLKWEIENLPPLLEISEVGCISVQDLSATATAPRLYRAALDCSLAGKNENAVDLSNLALLYVLHDNALVAKQVSAENRKLITIIVGRRIDHAMSIIGKDAGFKAAFKKIDNDNARKCLNLVNAKAPQAYPEYLFFRLDRFTQFDRTKDVVDRSFDSAKRWQQEIDDFCK